MAGRAPIRYAQAKKEMLKACASKISGELRAGATERARRPSHSENGRKLLLKLWTQSLRNSGRNEINWEKKKKMGLIL